MADPQTVQSILAGQSISAAASPAGGTDQAKVKDLAAQFEAMMLSQLLKGLQSSMMDGEDSPDGFKAGPLGDVMTQELGLALSRAGGFGLGTMLAGAMDRMPGVDAQGASGAAPSSLDVTSLIAAATAGSSGDASVPPAVSVAPDPAAGIVGAPAAPVLPRISSAFGWRTDPIDGDTRFHKGLDMPMPVGTDVRAPADGQVVSAGEQTGYGLTVVVSHGNGIETRYAHLSSADVKAGDTVRAGELIAQSGNSGRSTGPHLHFELTMNGQAVDPTGWAASVVSRPPAGQ